MAISADDDTPTPQITDLSVEHWTRRSPLQYNSRPLPRCHLELQVHGNFHRLMETKYYVG